MYSEYTLCLLYFSYYNCLHVPHEMCIFCSYLMKNMKDYILFIYMRVLHLCHNECSVCLLPSANILKSLYYGESFNSRVVYTVYRPLIILDWFILFPQWPKHLFGVYSIIPYSRLGQVKEIVYLNHGTNCRIRKISTWKKYC